MRAALYMRVSSDKQAKEGDSIPAQRAALHEYAESHGFTVAGEYLDDGISGTKYSQRDELQKMIADVEAGKIDIILFTKLDRFFRSVRHYTAAQEILDKRGVGWTAIWEPVYDTTTPHGRLIVNQMMSIAQFEAENTSQRIKSVFAYKVSQGEVVSGSTPPGYSISKKHLVPNEDAPHVLAAFELYSKCGNLNQVCMEMGGKNGLPAAKPGMKHVLTNPIYIGRHPSGVDGFCAPIVPDQLWHDVQRQIGMNVKSSQKETYIFSGLIVCAECGRAFASLTRRRTRGNCRTVEHLYRCCGHYMRRPPVCGNTKLLSENPLERHLIALVKPQIEGLALEYEIAERKSRDRKKEAAALEKKLERLKTLFVDGQITLSEYRADRERIDARLASLEAQEAPQKPPETLLSPDVWDVYETFSNAEKRRFWRGIVERITFDSERNIDVSFL